MQQPKIEIRELLAFKNLYFLNCLISGFREKCRFNLPFVTCVCVCLYLPLYALSKTSKWYKNDFYFILKDLNLHAIKFEFQKNKNNFILFEFFFGCSVAMSIHSNWLLFVATSIVPHIAILVWLNNKLYGPWRIRVVIIYLPFSSLNVFIVGQNNHRK